MAEIKSLFMKLYKGFPNSRLSEEIVHKIIISKTDRDFLIDEGFLLQEEVIDSEGKEKKYYNLGPNALSLISSWKMERLTVLMTILTVATFILALTTLVTTIIP